MPEIDIGTPVANAVDWLTENFEPLFDAIHAVMEFFTNVVLYLLTAPAPFVVIAVFTALAFWARKWGFAAFTLLAFLLVDAMGLWIAAMQSLAIVLVATVLAVAVSIPVGVWAARSDRASSVVRPVLDFMQTLPVFVYLIPAVFFFGIGAVPAGVATLVFAIAPGVRLTELGIRTVDAETVEAAHAFGAKPWQILREVQLPLAMPSIMAGVNQVLMLALSMVVIAGMVGAGGLGAEVMRGISNLDVGTGFQGGVAVVILAIFLDRLTSAFAAKKRRRKRRAPAGPTATTTPGTAAQPERDLAAV
ncbi:glycine betaine/proline transport system permease protein [Quadrisphaera granulorum]|uniref:Glycine betaine/proline transport system permease protein n=1 Tax=Quadrisphaera granulorum TaxID=317664 RepID=A0A315ZTC7_9ACTN|nr:proline/glycine betaine ABC transporter permease [Quadrisphaera granulorum]PWJ48816.1 glycine betaine/proline transport system permease protein [Quadrisphaera granulorum]SZE98298.1 glycine betaine/proline transport system permease protein [Quadrisphaera granulorum]